MDHSRARVSAAGLDPSGDGFFDEFVQVLAVDAERALTVAQAAADRAEGDGDEAGAVRAQLARSLALDALGRPEHVAELAVVLRRAQELGDPVLLLRATYRQVTVDIYEGRYADALVRGQAMLGLAHALRRPDLLERLLNNLATALDLIGEHALSISMYAECKRLLARQAGGTRLNSIRAANNEAEAWCSLARTCDPVSRREERAEALAHARSLAEDACRQVLDEPNVAYRLSTLDTLVSVLLELEQPGEAMSWVQRVAQAPGGDLENPLSPHWGMYALVLTRVELASEAPDLPRVLERLRAIEALPGSRFRRGEMQAVLQGCLSEALERLGQYQEAMRYHRQWLQFEARTQSLWAREHAMAVHHTLESLRGETEEFITHDLRNPLGAALVQMGSIAAHGGLDAAGSEELRAARSQVQQAFDAADHYLTIVRIRNLRRTALSTLDLAELVDDVGERLAPPAASATRLERDVEWGLEIRGDRISLLMAFDLVLRRALESAREGRCVGWSLRAESRHAVLVAEGCGNAWADPLATSAMDARQGESGGERMAAAMLMRVARLHDSHIEQIVGTGGSARIEWRFPLVGVSGD
ncbi:hypothetical protein [Ideonella sp.]|uniref:hypothetical protein n=1 Tax=Ideonella sp. TaxID=1929293 RepID=UPI002B4685A8|nr:hypothetical protein [Ideonella sp.]HJV68136.1 hypothetical protein [Ideonella sp.]